jgi:hypothetical protein
MKNHIGKNKKKGRIGEDEKLMEGKMTGLQNT